MIEFNCRFGDPETQPIMMRFTVRPVELCLAGAQGKLAGKPRCGIRVLALGGDGSRWLSGDYRKGDVINGLDIPGSRLQSFPVPEQR